MKMRGNRKTFGRCGCHSQDDHCEVHEEIRFESVSRATEKEEWQEELEMELEDQWVSEGNWHTSWI